MDKNNTSDVNAESEEIQSVKGIFIHDFKNWQASIIIQFAHNTKMTLIIQRKG